MTRNNKIDILKGIGIISIVLGHALNTSIFYADSVESIRKFVYIFNIAVFVFCSGYLFKDEYTTDLQLYFTKKIKSLYLPYLQYNFLLWIASKILGGGAALWSALLFQSKIDYSGAMWFVPLLFLTETIYCVSEKVLQKMRFVKWDVLLYVFCGMLGILLCVCGVRQFRVDVALTLVPVMYLGKWYRLHEQRIEKAEKWYGVFVFGIIIFAINHFTGKEIEFSLGRLYGGYLLYPVLAVGILFCLSLCTLIRKVSMLEKCICLLGRNSYAVMALHFLVFRLVDIVYGYITGQIEFYSPYTFPQLRVIYIVFGISIPVAIGMLLKQINWNITHYIKRFQRYVTQ